jgi:hypothetical protein
MREIKVFIVTGASPGAHVVAGGLAKVMELDRPDLDALRLAYVKAVVEGERGNRDNVLAVLKCSVRQVSKMIGRWVRRPVRGEDEAIIITERGRRALEVERSANELERAKGEPGPPNSTKEKTDA